ncbi:Nuclear pore complex protein Nup85 [Psidium guajava]|nr:Nuclear pore complex protein Nup85 [Psidium guajava]
MPGATSDSGGGALVPLSSETKQSPVYPLRHSVGPPVSPRVSVCWARGSSLRVSIFQQKSPSGGEGDSGGEVIEVKLNGGDGEISDARWRRIAYGSMSPFAMLQSRRNSVSTLSRISPSPYHVDWWEFVMEYSKDINALLGSPRSTPASVIEDPKTVLKKSEKPTSLKAAWELMELFYADKLSQAWLPERLIDWLADYDSLFSGSCATVHSKLVDFQNELINIQTESGLVEAVAVLISRMPRMRLELGDGRLGECYKAKPDFIKAWEKWRAQITKLDCSAYWIQCNHLQTREGLKNLLQIMVGNTNSLSSATYHWLELYVSHFLYVRPFTAGLESMHGLAQKCIQLKPVPRSQKLMGLLLGILGENTEVVLAECSKEFGPWMVAHAIELMTAGSDEAESLLCEEHYNLGELSIQELHRLVYAQVLSSHAFTWQIAPVYLTSCMKQGMGLLEILLCKQPVQHNELLHKNLEICRLYELDSVSSHIMKIAGVHHWKHGRKGAGVFWLQQARDEVRLHKIAQQLFASVGKSISDESFKQWEGLIELLGSDSKTAGGLEFLHKYRDFKRSLKHIHDGKSIEAARQAVESLMLNASEKEEAELAILNVSI